ncbi:MAG: transaldolase family protein [Planctomycetota bacterium]|jgi:transaldolase
MAVEKQSVESEVKRFVSRDFSPQFGRRREMFESNPSWRRLKELGSELWLDTGSLRDAEGLWAAEFSALTTNNTLLNKEVKEGTYDKLIPEAHRLLQAAGLAGGRLKLEMAFILNAKHALKLVEKFDAYVSVEEHTDLAGEVEPAVAYARRYHEICRDRFIIKIPFTAAGLLATRRLSREGIAVNHTLGFSARQNYVIARIARPAFVNVFLGRLNSFVADNKLGDGTYVGERATLASQRAVSELRRSHGSPSRQIGASFRAGEQIRDLAGIDVMTMPPDVARQFLELRIPPAEITNRTGEDYRPPLRDGVDGSAVGLHTLWDVGHQLVSCADALEQENLDAFTPDDLVGFFADHGCGDLLARWSDEQRKTSAIEGKIPELDNWREELKSGEVALDALMNLAGLNSFAHDQEEMDKHVRDVLAKKR